MKYYYIYVSNRKGLALQGTAKKQINASRTDRAKLLKEILTELEGNNQLANGRPRQLILTTPQCRLLHELNDQHLLGIDIPTIQTRAQTRARKKA